MAATGGIGFTRLKGRNVSIMTSMINRFIRAPFPKCISRAFAQAPGPSVNKTLFDIESTIVHIYMPGPTFPNQPDDPLPEHRNYRTRNYSSPLGVTTWLSTSSPKDYALNRTIALDMRLSPGALPPSSFSRSRGFGSMRFNAMRFDSIQSLAMFDRFVRVFFSCSGSRQSRPLVFNLDRLASF